MTKNKIKNLMDEFNQIIRWPKKPEDKELVIEFLSTKFKLDKKYSEKEKCKPNRFAFFYCINCTNCFS